MDKVSALVGFFRSLRLAIKTASFYPPNHPAYENAVKEIKEKADLLLNMQSPIRAGFSADSVFIDGFALESDKTFEDLARFFHLRRIKSLEVRSGVTQEEFGAFIRVMNLMPKDLVQQGGMAFVLQKEKIFHLAVEELDYSAFLKGEGEEVKDLWVYLLREAVESRDEMKMAEVADTFGSVIRRLSPSRLVEDPEVADDLKKFFEHLKEKGGDKFRACAASLFKSILKSKDLLSPEQLGRWKDLAKDMKDEDLAAALSDGVREGEEVEAAGVAIFARLVEPGRYRDILSFLQQIFKKVPPGASAGPVKDGMEELLSPDSGEPLAGHERWFLEMFLQALSTGAFRTIDREALRNNFLALLLDLLDRDEFKDRRGKILEPLGKELEKAVSDQDWAFFRALFDIAARREKELASNPVFRDINRLLSRTVEKRILDEDMSPDLVRFIPLLKKSAFGINYYLEKIFGENKITPLVLQLFYKLFMEYIFYFDINLDQKAGDIRFLEKLIDCLKEVDSPASLVTLKSIYSRGPDLLKTKVLRAMQKLSSSDEDFLLPILRKGAFSLKKEAVLILAREAAARGRAFEAMFRIPSPFGLRNRILRENLRLVDEAGLKDAGEYIRPLTRGNAFWNKGLRIQALRLLEKWDGR